MKTSGRLAELAPEGGIRLPMEEHSRQDRCEMDERHPKESAVDVKALEGVTFGGPAKLGGTSVTAGASQKKSGRLLELPCVDTSSSESCSSKMHSSSLIGSTSTLGEGLREELREGLREGLEVAEAVVAAAAAASSASTR